MNRINRTFSSFPLSSLFSFSLFLFLLFRGSRLDRELQKTLLSLFSSVETSCITETHQTALASSGISLPMNIFCTCVPYFAGDPNFFMLKSRLHSFAHKRVPLYRLWQSLSERTLVSYASLHSCTYGVFHSRTPLRPHQMLQQIHNTEFSNSSAKEIFITPHSNLRLWNSNRLRPPNIFLSSAFGVR